MKRLLSLLMTTMLLLSICTCCTVGAVDLNGVEEDLGENIALGKPVTAPYQYNANFSIEKINDGKIGTSWAGYRSQKIGERFDEYDKVVVDLGMVYDLTCIVVRSRRDVNDATYRSSWAVQVASEPRPYKDAVLVGEKLAAGEFGSDLVIKFDEPFQGRYIIFYHIRKGYAIVSEIEAYGSVSSGKPTPVYGDVDNKGYDAVEAVSKLGIMEGLSNTEFGGDNLIRRGEAAQIISTIANLPVSKKETSSFSDVDAGNEYIDYIEACLSAGIISKAEQYRPYDFIRATEFLKMTISAMGYDFVLPRFGEYPNNVLSLAAELELTKNINIKDSEYINRLNIAKILYNALLIPSTRITEFTEDASLYSAGSNMLKSTFGLELKNGVVTENETTNLIEPVDGQSNAVKIDGIEYFDPNGKLYNMIGRSVMYLVDDEKEIFDVWLEKSRQTITTIYSKDVVFDETTLDEIVVDTGDEYGEESYTIKDQPYVLKNGVAYGGYSENSLDIPAGKAELIDNNGDGTIDVIHIWDPQVIVVDHVINKTDRIAIFGVNGENVDISRYKYLTVKNGDKTTDASTILGGMLVYAYISEDGNNVRFEIMKNYVDGTLTHAEDDLVAVDEKEHGVSDYFTNNISNAPRLTLGMKARFFFDEHNDLVWIDNVEFKKVSDVIGVTLVYEKPKALTNASIMMFNENSEFSALNFADKVKIDGNIYTQAKLETLMTENPEYLKGKMAVYTTNNQGEISVLDTEYYDALKEPGSNLKRMNVSISASGAKTALGFYSGYNMLLPMVNVFPIFRIPFSGTTPLVSEEYHKYYLVSTSTKEIPSGSNSKIDESFIFYNADELGCPTLGMRKIDASAGGEAQGVVESVSATGMVVDTLSVVNNTDGTQSYKIVGYDLSTGEKTELLTQEGMVNVVETCKIRNSSVSSSWYTTYRLIEEDKLAEVVAAGYVSSILTLKKGDIVRYETNDDGKLDALERTFDQDIYLNTTNYKTIYAAGDAYSNVRAQHRLAYAEFLGVKDGYILTNSGGSNTDLFKYEGLAAVYVCQNGKLTKCESTSEAALYTDVATDMVIFSKSGTYYSVVIYID